VYISCTETSGILGKRRAIALRGIRPTLFNQNHGSANRRSARISQAATLGADHTSVDASTQMALVASSLSGIVSRSMMKPILSVLIDTYNHERYIEQAVVSAIEQDFPASEYEIVVVDDGSTDRTAEIVGKFAPRVRLLSKKNGGQASAFNAGFAELSGDIVAFLDGDDWFAKGKLTAVMNALEKEPEAAAIGHGYYKVREDTSETDACTSPPDKIPAPGNARGSARGDALLALSLDGRAYGSEKSAGESDAPSRGVDVLRRWADLGNVDDRGSADSGSASFLLSPTFRQLVCRGSKERGERASKFGDERGNV
jgi:hypothetical protein